jgi:hypothetical protein
VLLPWIYNSQLTEDETMDFSMPQPRRASPSELNSQSRSPSINTTDLFNVLDAPMIQTPYNAFAIQTSQYLQRTTLIFLLQEEQDRPRFTCGQMLLMETSRQTTLTTSSLRETLSKFPLSSGKFLSPFTSSRART